MLERAKINQEGEEESWHKIQTWREAANPAVKGEANQFIEFTIKNTGNGKRNSFVDAFLKYINNCSRQ